MSAENAAYAAVYVHGAAGDIGAKAVGKTSLIASDIIQYLPAAFSRITGE